MRRYQLKPFLELVKAFGTLDFVLLASLSQILLEHSQLLLFLEELTALFLVNL